MGCFQLNQQAFDSLVHRDSPSYLVGPVIQVVGRGMTPMLVASNEAGWVVLVIQMPCPVGVDEHAVGIIHEMLRRGEVHLGSVPSVIVADNGSSCRNLGIGKG